MARVHFVKKARKANKAAGVKKGESYYWWANRVGRSSIKRYSKTPPRRCQTTNSEFYAAMYAAEDDLADIAGDARNEKAGHEDVSAALREAANFVEEARDMCQEKYDNMENAFPSGCPTMELLQSRIDSCESIMQELESAADEVDSLEESDEDDATPLIEQAADIVDGVDWSYE